MAEFGTVAAALQVSEQACKVIQMVRGLCKKYKDMQKRLKAIEDEADIHKRGAEKVQELFDKRQITEDTDLSQLLNSNAVDLKSLQDILDSIQRQSEAKRLMKARAFAKMLNEEQDIDDTLKRLKRTEKHIISRITILTHSDIAQIHNLQRQTNRGLYQLGKESRSSQESIASLQAGQDILFNKLHRLQQTQDEMPQNLLGQLGNYMASWLGGTPTMPSNPPKPALPPPSIPPSHASSLPPHLNYLSQPTASARPQILSPQAARARRFQPQFQPQFPFDLPIRQAAPPWAKEGYDDKDDDLDDDEDEDDRLDELDDLGGHPACRRWEIILAARLQEKGKPDGTDLRAA